MGASPDGVSAVAGARDGEAAAGIRIEMIDAVEAFAALRDEWDELLEASAADCPFLTWEWLYTWWRHLSAGRELRLIIVRRDGTLIAAGPLAMSPRRVTRLVPFRRLEFLGTGSVGSDYLDIIVRRGAEAEALDALAEHLDEHQAVLELAQVKRSASAAAELAAKLAGRRWCTVERVTEVCPFIPLAGRPWPEYLAGLDGHHRSNFRRRCKKLGHEEGFRFECARTEGERAESLQALVALHGKRWRERGGSTALYSPALLAFHEEWTRRALARGWLRLFVMRLDDQPVAALYGLHYRDVFYFYQTGFDPAFARHGVGQVTVGLTIEHAIDHHAREYDLLHGDETYKFDWARDTREIGCIELYPPSLHGRVCRHTAAVGRRARKLARAVLPAVITSWVIGG